MKLVNTPKKFVTRRYICDGDTLVEYKTPPHYDTMEGVEYVAINSKPHVKIGDKVYSLTSITYGGEDYPYIDYDLREIK